MLIACPIQLTVPCGYTSSDSHFTFLEILGPSLADEDRVIQVFTTWYEHEYCAVQFPLFKGS